MDEKDGKVDLKDNTAEQAQKEASSKKTNNDDKQKSRLLKIRISFVALIVISALTFFYDTYLYNREASKIEEMKKNARIEKERKETEKEETEPEKPDVKEEEAVPELPPEPVLPPYESPIDFNYWWSINPDVIGYVHVPGTNIDYPILYDKDDNERYLHESIDGKTTVHGSIYLDNLAKPDFTSRNNLIYGHNMRDGSMFKDVVKYKKVDYLKEHQTVYIYTPEREIKLRAIAAFYGTPDGKARQTIFLDNTEFGKFITARLAHSKDVGELPGNDVSRITQLFCLVTCSYEFDNARTFLYCIKESDYEEPVVVEETVEEVTR